MDAQTLKIGNRVSFTDWNGREDWSKVYGHIVNFDADTVAIWSERNSMAFKKPDEIEDEE
jgi:hypothetical protein